MALKLWACLAADCSARCSFTVLAGAAQDATRKGSSFRSRSSRPGVTRSRTRFVVWSRNNLGSSLDAPRSHGRGGGLRRLWTPRIN